MLVPYKKATVTFFTPFDIDKGIMEREKINVCQYCLIFLLLEPKGRLG